MEIKNLKPDEILTTKDFPVYSLHILKIYFRICESGNELILPPTPVIPLSVGLPLLSGESKKIEDYNLRIKKYLKENEKIKYILIDGTHKTTALTLTHKPIHAMVLETDDDIKEVKYKIETGEIFGIYEIENIKKELKKMAEHFKDAGFFESVEDKTRRMIKKDVLPKYMVKSYDENST
jgi:hypothetical protein